MPDKPFMEHPAGEYNRAIDAMEVAISRLRALPEWNQWITFCAQGEGSAPETTCFAEIRVLAEIIDPGVRVNLAQLAKQAQVRADAISDAGGTRYSIASTTAREAAQILDALFRYELRIRPFPDEDDDYAVGAEW